MKRISSWCQASLVRRVLVPVVALFVVAVVLSASIVRKVSVHELEEVLTANLSTSAKSLFAVIRHQLALDDAVGLQEIIDDYSAAQAPLANETQARLYERELANQRYIYLQLFDPRTQTVVSSRASPLLAKDAQTLGFFSVAEAGHVWQMYGLNDSQTGAWFYMGQRDDYWSEIRDESNEAMLAALLLLCPLLAALIGFGVVRGLLPLRRLRDDIDHRESGNLQAIDTSDTVAETQPLVQALNALLARLEQSLSNERQFTADAAHELRTPIASLRAQLGVLSGARSTAERDSAVMNIDRATVRMASLVDNLLALARLDTGAAPSAPQRFELRHCLEHILADHAPLAIAKDIEISFYACGDFHLTGHAYLHELLFANLIHNAIKYTPSGGTVDVRLYEKDQSLHYCVDDSGPGVPPEELVTLTERFRRVRNSGGESAEGSGLGLSIAQRCAQLSGSELSLNNRDGQGFSARVRTQ